MSCKIAKSELTRKQILQLKNDLYVEGVGEYENPTVDAWGETTNSFYLPYYYFKKHFKTSEKDYEKTGYIMNNTFKNDEQKSFFDESYNILKRDGSVLVAAPTGWGKTFCAINMAFKTKLKTAILVHRSILVEQWQQSIERFTNASVQIVKDSIIPDNDFYIFNIAYVSKYYDSELKQWKKKKLGQKDLNMGILIVDEAHIACASEMVKALQYFEPKYSVALTATPKRRDGLDPILELYFGEKVVRISQTPFKVFRVATGIKPEFGKDVRGKKKWGDVVNFLAVSEKRNKMIVNIVVKNKKNTILIMCKLKKHCDILYEMLSEKCSTTVMKGADKEYDKTARVLISTFSKLGVGFDDERLDMLILGCSVKDIEQYAGRLRYKEGGERIIYDFVDDDYNCVSHWLERRKWYLSRNGSIEYVNENIKEMIEKVDVRPRFAKKLV